MTTDAGAGRPYNVQGYPTIKIFGADKKNPIDYNSGERTFDKFVDFLMSEIKK
jgi:protein disulfide-isomerase A6